MKRILPHVDVVSFLIYSIMNSEDFIKAVESIVKFIVMYKNCDKNILLGTEKFSFDILPGQLMNNFKKFPMEGVDINIMLDDFYKDVLPTLLNWQHPYFFGFFPSCNSYPSILGELLSAGLGLIAFSWKSSPGATELELFCINELIRYMRLPFNQGLFLSSSSEAILISVVRAKYKYKKNYDKLVMYTSDLAHSCVFKAAKITNTIIKCISTNNKYSMRKDALIAQIEEDLEKGNVPFMVVATFGTTGVCSFDNLKEIGSVCKMYGMVMHVDAAYAGGAVMCRKYRKMLKGIEFADSFNTNLNKLLLVNYDCTMFVFKCGGEFYDSLSIDPPYLNSEYNMLDLRNYDISLSRRFRALKVWFTMCVYGVRNIRKHMIKMFKMAKLFKELLAKDTRVKIVNKVVMGLVCFSMTKGNEYTKLLYSKINILGDIYITTSMIKNIFFIRVSMNNVIKKNIVIESVKYIVKLIDEVYEHMLSNIIVESQISNVNNFYFNFSDIKYCNKRKKSISMGYVDKSNLCTYFPFKTQKIAIFGYNYSKF